MMLKHKIMERGFCFCLCLVKRANKELPGGSVVKKSPANAEDMGLITGLGRSHTPQNN